jgi:hypothetical protein
VELHQYFSEISLLFSVASMGESPIGLPPDFDAIIPESTPSSMGDGVRVRVEGPSYTISDLRLGAAIIVKTQIRHPILAFSESERTLISIREMAIRNPAFRLKRS